MIYNIVFFKGRPNEARVDNAQYKTEHVKTWAGAIESASELSNWYENIYRTITASGTYL